MRALGFFIVSGFIWALLELSFGFTLRDWLMRLVALARQSGI